MREGLEHNIRLVIAKAVIVLLDQSGDPTEPFRMGLDFGARYRRDGWGQGLTILTCMMNLLPHLDPEDRPWALFHGLSAVAVECAGEPPRFGLRPLPKTPPDFTNKAFDVAGWECAEPVLTSLARGYANAERMEESNAWRHPVDLVEILQHAVAFSPVSSCCSAVSPVCGGHSTRGHR